MKLSYSITTIAFSIMALALHDHCTLAVDLPRYQSKYKAQERRTLQPYDSIIQHIHKGGATKSPLRFTIIAELQDGGNPSLVASINTTSTAQLFAGSAVYKKPTSAPSTKIAIDVVEAINPAVNSDTMVVVDDIPTRLGDTPDFPKMLHTLLVSDTTTSAGRESVTILAIDPQTNELNGIVDQKGSSVLIVHQHDGGMVTAEEKVVKMTPKWKCGVSHDVISTVKKNESSAGLFQRTLEKHYDDNDHGDHLDHRQAYDQSFSMVENISNSLRGTKINPLNKRRLQNSASLPYSFQVDLFIEIDNEFIFRTGGGTPGADGIPSNAKNYINALITAANVVYESEIDTHIHVHTIKLSTIYNSAVSTNDALNIMKAKYGSNSWHTSGVDLHHALLGKNLGGGVAFLGVLCDSLWGYGLTANLKGNFANLNAAAVWDLYAFMHEIGHNFGSWHTHDNDYVPVIDTCGTSCPVTAGNKWATLMSYCHLCNGYDANLMYTFGGVYDGSGAKSDISNWIDTPALIANSDSTHRSINPRRVSHKMYSHVSTRGDCVAINVIYDSSLTAPRCINVGASCFSGSLLSGRSSLGPGESGNAPNTLDTCNDGGLGSYKLDESVESIKISSTNGGLLKAGEKAEIEASVFAFSVTDDYADFYYTTNPMNPSWIYIGTYKPTGTGIQSIKAQYTLPMGSLQAVRVIFRYKGTAKSCPSGDYDDVDDIAFTVASSPSPPTNKPTSKSPTRKPTSIVLPTTNKPTSKSTSKPSTRQPTGPPTNKPTTQPPTEQPTSMAPTTYPPTSMTPTTNQPTSMAPTTDAPSSAAPTTDPPTSAFPTNDPTLVPTTKPTSTPTPLPTSRPTAKPKFKPTSVPTSKPSMPIHNPSQKPTMKPIFNPVQPTSKPTSKPSAKPTLKPIS